MNHISLFSGIGGFDLAAEWVGWRNIAHCEINPFCQKVLKHHFPQSISYHDITKSDFSIHSGLIDIISGGFPCQPYSLAGKREGDKDERHLWPAMLNAIRVVKPTYILGENVPGIINWSEGMVFEQVQSELEDEGYEVLTFVLPVAGINAPHRRDRVWFVAYSAGLRSISRGQVGDRKTKDKQEWNGLDLQATGLSKIGAIANTNGEGLQISRVKNKLRQEISIQGAADNGSYKKQDWSEWPIESPVCSRNDGISERLDNITFPKWRKESIKAAGNSVSPQLVLQIFKAIKEFDLSQK